MKKHRGNLLVGASALMISFFVSSVDGAAQTQPCPGTESREVICRDYLGNPVADSYCARVGARPRATKPCTASCASGDGGGDGDPLIFDIDGDGITLLSAEDSNVMFDMDNDGVADATGWVDGRDGILVMDDNGNSLIDNQSEMFGNTEKLAYKHLAEYDTNGDGRITQEDSVWSKLEMWVDGNVNGVSEPHELMNLDDIGIEEIDLDYDTVDEIHAGNQVTGFGSFVRRVGEHGHKVVSAVMEALFSFFSG